MDTYTTIENRAASGRPFCVATVLSVEGSTPREVGACALVDADGRIEGTIGGGMAEAEAQRSAVEACRTGRPHLLTVEMEGAEAAESEPLCGGLMLILLDPTATKDVPAYAAAAVAVRERRRGLLVTVVHESPTARTEVRWHSEAQVTACGWSEARVDGQTARACLAQGAPVHLTTGPGDNPGHVLVQPVLRGPRLVIAGGGHVGQALAAQGALVGFEILVIDDRPEFADPALCGDIAAMLAALPADEATYVAIVTRGHRHDAEALRACIGRPFAYVGMIGSRRKVALIHESLLAAGLATPEQLDAVYAPIGLDIGAETPGEIAASVVAELIAVRRRGESPRQPRSLRDR
jgi:xanthine dehydrogenase accessory factor